MKMIGVPRFQGRTGVIEEPPELAGQYAYEILLSIIGDGKEPTQVYQSGPFKTDVEAKADMRKTVSEMVKLSQEAVGAVPNGDYVDLKQNRIMNFKDEE